MRHIVAFLVVALVSGAAGYCFGFRQAWSLGLMADAPVRGAIAVAHLNSMERGQLDSLRTQFQADVDLGLVLWAQLEQFPLHGALNTLSGQAVVPESLRYVQRVATYRKTHASPLADPELVRRTIESARADDPEFADQLVEDVANSDAAIARMIEKYAQ